MDSIKDIAIGFANLITGTNDEIAEQRIKICTTGETNGKPCPHFWHGACSLCACALAARARNLGLHCKINKW